MTTKSVDIETASLWDELTPAQRAHVTALFDKSNHGPDETPESRTALNPQTGKVIAASLYDVEAETGVVYYERPRALEAAFTHALSTKYLGAELVPCHTEAELLTRVWADLAKAGRIVTFNGYRFDVPFLHRRALTRGVAPTRDLLTKWYDRGRVFDVREELSAMGHVAQYNLNFACEEFGVPTPKRELDGRHVGEAYRRGEILKIASYCYDDTVAQAGLYLKIAPLVLNWRGHRA